MCRAAEMVASRAAKLPKFPVDDAGAVLLEGQAW